MWVVGSHEDGPMSPFQAYPDWIPWTKAQPPVFVRYYHQSLLELNKIQQLTFVEIAEEEEVSSYILMFMLQMTTYALG